MRVVAAALVAACAAVFAFIAEDVFAGGGLISRDQAVLNWFVEHRTEGLIRAAKLVSTLGGFVSLLGVAALLGVWLARRGWHVALSVAPAVALLLAGLTSTIAKNLFDRDRPPVAVHATKVTLAAFPSGHATDAAAFFLAAALTLSITVAHRRPSRVVLIGGGMLLAAAVGLSRLVLAVHWLSDVVAGWALGTGIAITIVVGLWYATTRDSSGGVRAQADGHDGGPS